nr:Rv1535 domain-containing protein [Mycobacterium sp.]
MSTTDRFADLLAAELASLLTIPLTELYAVLWRAGVVQVGSSGRSVASASADPTAGGSPRPRRQSPPLPMPAPAPRPVAPAEYSQAAG